MKTIVLRLLFLVGFLALSRCEQERAIQIKIDGNEVYRNAYYVDKERARLSCHVPRESNDKYDELAIYQGNVTKDKTPLCKASNLAGCSLTRGNDPSLSIEVEVNKDGSPNSYTCQYDKAPEPPVKPATVTLHFKNANNQVKILDENNREIQDIRSLQVTNETSFRLTCPGPEEEGIKVHWYRNEHELKFDHGNAYYELNDTTHNLTFKKSKSPDASKFGGYYRCERVNKEGKVVASGFAKINSFAFATAASKSYNKMEGESVTMSCDVDGEPVPKVSWKRDGKPLGAGDDENSKRISYSSYKGIPGASVTIRDLVAEDYGDYICAASSSDGSYAEAPTLLRVRSKLAALWPFLGIVAEVIILVAVIFIYEKRRAKKEQEENEDAADQKKSLTASNNENKDVRQRKA